MELLKKEDLLKSLNNKIKHTEELMSTFKDDNQLYTLYLGMNVSLCDFKNTIEKCFK